MSSFGSPSPFFIAGTQEYQVKRSLRFNDDNSAYLNRTPSSTSNRKTFTISWWFKIGNIPASGTFKALFGAYDNSTSGDNGYWLSSIFDSDGRLYLAAWTLNWRRTTRQFRDPSAWYHCIFAVDTTQSTAADRIKIYVNGVEETSFGQNNNPSQNFDLPWNFSSVMQTIGRVNYTGGGSAPYSFDGYIAEFNSIDGLQLTPSSFGETNPVTGQWIPKKYVGSYGTNGFYLNFLDNSGTTATTLGKDVSGNGNNFTPNNFSVAAGTGNDSLEDTPTNNFPTFNPLIRNVNTFSEGNLQVTMTSNAPPSFYSTIGASSGKYYMEFLLKSVTNYPLGISGSTQDSNYFSLGDQIGFWVQSSKTNVFRNGSDITANSEVVGNFQTGVEGTSTTWAVDDIAGLALDMDNKIIYLYKGATQVGYVNFSTFNYDTVFFGGGNYINGNVYIGNFGQRTFAHTPPTGYKSLCSANLPDPTIKLPNKHFDTTLYTGNNSSQEISTLNFQPDWLWFKSRSSTSWHGLFDSVRGRALGLATNVTNTEYTSSASNDLVSFDDDGFTLGSNQNWGSVNGSGNSIVTWAWNGGDTDGKTYTVKVVSDSGNKYRFDNFGTSAVTLDLAEGGTYIFDQSDSSNAGHPLRFSTTSNGTHGGGTEYTIGVTTAGTPGSSGAYTQIVVAASAPTLYYYCSVHSGMGGQANTNSTLGSSNFDGAIQSTVKANLSAGFSIGKFTGTGSSNTVGTGLIDVQAVILKNRGTASTNWVFYHDIVDGSYDYMYLNTYAANANSALTHTLGNTFKVGDNNDTNASSANYIFYAFSQVAGFSKFGKYTGNGSTNGTFVYTGFRPALVITKQTNGAGSWFIFDNKRNGYNETDPYLLANVANVEASDLGWDLLSNGFKLRNTYAATNGSNNTFIYLAFAESPFKNARAR